MATLSKHGANKQIEYVGYKKAYCQDGTTLINKGNGWKVKGKLKAGIDYTQAYENAVTRQGEKFRNFPLYAKFFKLIKDMAPSINKRSYLVMGLEMLGNDPDGLWSEFDDRYDTRGEYTIDDICELCKAYEAAMCEQVTSR